MRTVKDFRNQQTLANRKQISNVNASQRQDSGRFVDKAGTNNSLKKK